MVLLSVPFFAWKAELHHLLWFFPRLPTKITLRSPIIYYFVGCIIRTHSQADREDKESKKEVWPSTHLKERDDHRMYSYVATFLLVPAGEREEKKMEESNSL